MKTKSLFRNIFSIFSTNLFVIGIVVISGIILPRLLTPSSLGKLNSIIALAAIVYSFTFLGMRSSLVMHIGKKIFELDQIIKALTYIYILSVCLSTLGLVLFFSYLSTDQYSLLIIGLVCLINPFEFLVSYMQGYNLAFGKIGSFNRLRWIPKFVYLLAIILFLALLKYNIEGAVLSLIISNLLTLVLYYRTSETRIPSLFKSGPPIQVILSLLRYGSLFALAFLVTRLNHKIDILLLKRMSSLAEVGYYSLGANVAETIWQVPIAAGIVLMAKSATNKDQELVSRQVCATLRISILIVSFAAIVLYIIAPYLVSILFGSRYNPSVSIIRIILPGILFFVVLKIINSQFIGTGKPQLTLIALVPSLILNIVLNLFLIPIYKGIGAAIATNISYFVACALLLVIYQRIFGLSNSEIFRYRKSDFAFLRKIAKK